MARNSIRYSTFSRFQDSADADGFRLYRLSLPGAAPVPPGPVTAAFSLAGGNFSQNWSNTGLITADDNWSGVNSIIGYRGDDLTTSTGADPQIILADGSGTPVDVIANQTNPDTLVTGGIAEFDSLANPTIALNGSGTADAPHIVIQLDATGRSDIRFQCNLRDLDGSVDNAVQPVAIQYRVGGSGSWINLPTAFVADATTGPSLATLVTPVDVTLPAAANNAALVEIRIITTNAAGNDEWVGIDDILVSSNATPGAGAGSFGIADQSVAEGNSGATPMVFTISRTGGDDGAVSVDYSVVFNGTASAADLTGTTSGTVNFADGETSKTITLNVAGDLDVETNETFTVTLSNAQGGALIADANATGTITNDDSGPLAIHTVQGAGSSSPFVGQVVTVQGIVTAVDSNGYYLQGTAPDADDATSEGIFVFTSGAPPAGAALGNLVSVTGTVAEFAPSGSLPLTEITSSTLSVISTGNSLPDAVILGAGGRTPPTENLAAALAFYESLEGMRVIVKAPQVVSDTNSFGETWVVANGGAGATGLNARGGITISAGDFNPERIQIDNDANLSPTYNPAHTQGDILGDVTGILNYANQSYEVLVTGTVATTTNVTLSQEVTTLQGDLYRLTVATYNVENMDPTDPQTKFDMLANDIVVNLLAPDIIGLQEVQDADGPGTGSDLSGAASAQKLINAIVAAGGPTYSYVEVAPLFPNSTGGEDNGNIRNGYLYNAARVSYVAGSALLLDDSAFTNSRRPLVAEFTFNGKTVQLINVHLTSRLGSSPLMGSPQPPTDAGDAARTAQANVVRAYINNELATDPNLKLGVLGDFNGFYFENAIGALEAGGVMTDLHRLLPAAERYSYMFEGNAQALDHILANAALGVDAAFDAVHLNSEFSGTAGRPTDHDSMLARLLISGGVDGATPNPDYLIGTGGSELIDGLAGQDTIYGRGGNDSLFGRAGNDSLIGEDGNDYLDGGEDNDYLEGGAGADALVGGAGDDIGFGGAGADNLIGGDGNDYLEGGDDVDYLEGGTGNDALIGGAGNDIGFGGAGADNLFGGDGNDYLEAGDDADYLDGGVGNDALIGGAGDDIGFGGAGLDNLIGGNGNDYLEGGDDSDYFEGGLGNDALVGGAGDDIAFGGDGSDNLIGGDGNDYLVGGGDADYLDGGIGNDLLNGGTGANILQGGSGVDAFQFTAAPVAGNFATVLDFLAGTDKLMLDDSVFTGIGGSSALDPSAFRAGTAAQDADDRIIYDAGTGALLYDADGNGAGAAIQFASLSAGLNLAASDFVVI